MTAVRSIYGVMTLFSFAMLGTTHGEPSDPQGMAAQGWDFLKKQQYAASTNISEKCVSAFGPKARRVNADALKNGEQVPITGEPQDSGDRNRIKHYAFLNDVVACYYILATSYENTHKCAAAKGTYDILKDLNYGRIWDPTGQKFVWDPSENAQDWIANKSSLCK